MSLDDIRDAIAGADREAVEALLNAEDSDLDAFSVNALFGMCVLAAAQSQSRNESRHLLEIGRLLVARGARADGPLGNERLLQSPLVMPITSLNDSDEIVAYKKWLRRPHRSVLRLRSLVSRGRATLKRRRSRRRAAGGSDARAAHAIEFLVKLGDNGIVWNILPFWKETN